MRRRTVLLPLLAATAAGGLALTGTPAASAGVHHDRGPTVVGPYKHLVVIYEENHSFDNLYGGWGTVDGQQVDGLADASRCTPPRSPRTATPTGACCRTTSTWRRPPLPTTCVDPRARRAGERTSPTSRSRSTTTSSRPTRPARRPASSPPTACSKDSRALPGGCTRDLVHRFYQEQYQLNGGQQNRYVTGSDAVGLTMGHYDTKQLPIYQYLHAQGRAELRDRRPLLPGGVRRVVPQPPVPGRGARADRHRPGADAGGRPTCTRSWTRNGFPNATYPLYTRPRRCNDAQLTQACGADREPERGVRRLRGQHDPAGQPAARPAAPQLPADRRRPSTRTSVTG